MKNLPPFPVGIVLSVKQSSQGNQIISANEKSLIFTKESPLIQM